MVGRAAVTTRRRGYGEVPGKEIEKGAAQASTPGQRVVDSRAIEVAARVGLCARGVIYVLVGLLAVRIGLGGGSGGKEADRSGAVRRHPRCSNGSAGNSRPSCCLDCSPHTDKLSALRLGWPSFSIAAQHPAVT